MTWMGKRIIKKFDAVVTLGYVLQNRVSYPARCSLEFTHFLKSE